jgi:hypothetical protein
VDNNTCFGCIGNLDQNDIQQTKVLSIDIDQTVEPIRTEKSQQRKENADIIDTLHVSPPFCIELLQA